MKKFLLTLGILFIAASVLAFAAAALFWYAAYHAMDGGAGMFHNQLKMMTFCGGTGVVLLFAGIACLVLRRKM